MNSLKFNIRPPSNEAEWDVIKGLLIDYRHEFNDDTCFSSFEEEMNNIIIAYSRPDRFKLIAVEKHSGKIVGCVGLWEFSEEVCEMKRLYIIPSYRGFHLGKYLAEEIINVAVQNQYKSIVLDTMHEMKAAQNLYLSLGFHPVSPYNGQDESRLVCYERKLS